MTSTNIYSGEYLHVEDRILKKCDKCRKLRRLNIVQFSNGIVSYLCDYCTELGERGKLK